MIYETGPLRTSSSLLHHSGHPTEARQLREAADVIDMMHIAFLSAPHAHTCPVLDPVSGAVRNPNHCDCWKQTVR